MVAHNARLYGVYIVSQYTPLYWAYMYFLVTETRGLSATDFGLLKAIYYLSVCLLEIPLGVLADRIGRRPVLVAAAGLNSLGCFLYVLAIDFATFALAEICFAFSMALFSGSASALLYDSLASESRQADYLRIEGRARAASLVATTLGLPLTDLFLVGSGDPSPAYAVTGAIALVGVGSALAMREPPRHRAATTRDIATGAFQDLARTPALVWLIAWGAALFVMVRAANAFVFNPVLESAGVPVNAFGTVLATIGLIGALFAWRADAMMSARPTATLLALPLSLTGMFALLPATSGAAAVAVLCAQALPLGALPVIVSALLNDRIANGEHRATLLSLESLLSRGLYGAAALGLGWGLDRAGLSPVLLAVGAVGILPLALVGFVARATGPTSGSTGTGTS